MGLYMQQSAVQAIPLLGGLLRRRQERKSRSSGGMLPAYAGTRLAAMSDHACCSCAMLKDLCWRYLAVRQEDCRQLLHACSKEGKLCQTCSTCAWRHAACLKSLGWAEANICSSW